MKYTYNDKYYKNGTGPLTDCITFNLKSNTSNYVAFRHYEFEDGFVDKINSVMKDNLLSSCDSYQRCIIYTSSTQNEIHHKMSR